MNIQMRERERGRGREGDGYDVRGGGNCWRGRQEEETADGDVKRKEGNWLGWRDSKEGEES